MRFRRALQASYSSYPQMRAFWLLALCAWAALALLPALCQGQSGTAANAQAASAPAASSQSPPQANPTAKANPSPPPPKRPAYVRPPYVRPASLQPAAAGANPAPTAANPVPATAGPVGPASAQADGGPAAADPSPAAPGAEAPKAGPVPEPESRGAANAGAEDLVSAECADLLKLASSLKAEVDKTTKDELSVSVVRDAGQIEQMARKMREDTDPR